MSTHRIGQTIAGKYRLDRVLGEGGMGTVYEAWDLRLTRQVALKLVRAEVAAQAPQLVERFSIEARAAARLSQHPNIVTVYEDGLTAERVPYMAQELLQGESLGSFLRKRGALPESEARAILVPAMEAIAFAHAQQVVHRDLKPENVFLHRDARGTLVPKVVDFGIARIGTAPGLTKTGDTLGTLTYMAPEQLHGKGVGAWSDVWSMAVVWTECLTGRFPFDLAESDSPAAIMHRILF